MKLQCAVCGGHAPAKKQWFNQDRGWGICARCFAAILKKEMKTLGPLEGRQQALDWYGRPGVHHTLEQKPNIFDEVLTTKTIFDHHETDLYLPVNQKTQGMLERYPLEKSIARVFQSQIEHKPWYDVPFAYLPAWDSKR